jgi:single-strand DNA-binding protein
MASFNKVLLMGNLTRDPELRYTASGAAVASFGLAVNRKFKQGEEWKDEVCFVDITVWGKQGENCAQYLNKGSLVFLEGRLNYQTWEADGGQKRNKLEVVANNVQFLTRQGDKVSMDPGSASTSSSSADDIPF